LGLLNFRNKKHATTAIPANHDGKLPLQLIHEQDLTDILTMAIMKDMQGAYNVGSNILPDLEEFAKKEFGIKVRRLPQFLVKLGIKAGRIWKSLIWAQAILYNSLLDTEKIEQFHWKPKYSTEECIREVNHQ